MNTIKIRRKRKSLLDKISLLELSSAAIGAAFIELAVDGILMKAIVTVAVSLFLVFSAVASQTDLLNDRKLNKFLNKEGVLPAIGLAVVFGLCLYFLFEPQTANAQFFFDAETEIKGGVTSFGAETASMTTVVTMIFWMFRFLMVVYLGVSLVKIVGQMREEEDWKNTAKTPVFFLIIMTVGDQISKMLLGVA